jgi:hypothetical protein
VKRRTIPGLAGGFVLLSVIALAAAGAETAATKPGPADSASARSVDELLAEIEDAHPATYYVLASKLFEADRKEEAVFWFYAGQLRFRFHLLAHPDLEPSGDPALFASLSEVVGRPINEYAFGDIEALEASLRRVLAWDEKSRNGFTSKSENAEAWKTIRSGLEKLIGYLGEHAAEIRAQRTANGLENRR